MVVNDTQDLMRALVAVAPVLYISTDDTGVLQDVGYAPEATDAQKAAAQAVIDAWVDPKTVPSSDCKRLVQAMMDAGTLDAFLKAFTAAKPTDQHRWLKYDTVAQDNPVWNRICAAAVPPIDVVATMTAAIAK